MATSIDLSKDGDSGVNKSKRGKSIDLTKLMREYNDITTPLENGNLKYSGKGDAREKLARQFNVSTGAIISNLKILEDQVKAAAKANPDAGIKWPELQESTTRGVGRTVELDDISSLFGTLHAKENEQVANSPTTPTA